MTLDHQAYQDGPNTHKYTDAHFITSWTVVYLFDDEGVRHVFHVPTRIVEQLAAVDVQGWFDDWNRLRSASERTPYGVVPANCRLILASENLLDEWGTRTERGERITVEWGELSPEGWYTPTFTVHSDDRLVSLEPHSMTLDPDPLHPDDDPRLPVHPRRRSVSREFVERLRNSGASDYAVRLAESHVDPPPSRQPARSFLGCRWWVALAVTIAVAVLLIAAPDAAPRSKEGGGYLDRRSNPERELTTAPFVVPTEAAGTTAQPETATLSPAPTPTPEPTGAVGSALIGGWATFYDVGPGRYAAAGPLLRAALGPDWRGSRVLVVSDRAFVAVVLSDWCACGERRGMPTFIDLSREAFALLADPSVGIVSVEIEVME